jgi:uncharacterized protein YcbK (DUF882 family)
LSDPRGGCAFLRRRGAISIDLWHRIVMSTPKGGRREFLRSVGTLALGFAAARAARSEGESRRSLSFVHTHTGEQLTAVYFDGEYCAPVLQQVNQLLRDFRTEAVFPIDPAVLDRLYWLRSATGRDEPFHVISGYRSPLTNAALRARSSGVAEHSLHMQGRAVDVRMPGMPTAQLALLAQRQAGGGVGYYRVSDFVHVDTGRVRSWGDTIEA